MIPVEAVEAAAIGLHAFRVKGSPFEWRQLDEDYKDQWRNQARAALEAAAPHIMAAALRDAADAIDAQRDATNPDRKPEDGWSVVDHSAGRFLGKTVAARMIRARAADLGAEQ